jgi:lysophospholipase L1-like esterase
LLSAAVLTSVAGCSSPSGPTPPPPAPEAPAIVCPADVQSSIAEGTVANVSYAIPQASGGAAPVAVSCAQAPGTDFPIGSTPVTCTATDAQQRIAQCSFNVRVALAPRLRGTKILAFGDSITWGTVSPAVARVRTAGIPGSYPYILQDKLRARYTAQTITVINAGEPSERITGTGEDRLERVIEAERPDVLILLEGVNDINSGIVTPHATSEALRLAVRRSVNMNVPLVFVSTILPGVEGRIKPPNPQRVNELNDEIRSWAARERAVLLDTYVAVDPLKQMLIGEDGLHPTPAGFEFLASVFADAIKNHFEVPTAAPASFADPSWPFALR